jgi:hypothetical protein
MDADNNRYGAGSARLSAAKALFSLARMDDALLYARAGLRDYESLGAGGAMKARQTRETIALFEQRNSR